MTRAAVVAVAVAAILSTPPPQPETFSNVPPTLSGDDRAQVRIRHPKSGKALQCASKCVAVARALSTSGDPSWCSRSNSAVGSTGPFLGQGNRGGGPGPMGEAGPDPALQSAQTFAISSRTERMGPELRKILPRRSSSYIAGSNILRLSDNLLLQHSIAISTVKAWIVHGFLRPEVALGF